MSLHEGIQDFHDHDFERSTNEHHIFKEVFFGNEQGKTSKKCLVTGAIKFESDNKIKPIDMLVSRNREISAISSQFNVGYLNGITENSGPGFSSNEHGLSTRDDNIANDKRIKLSPEEEPVFNSVTCRLVESENQGLTLSCYLLKGDVPMRSLPSSNETDEKEIFGFKAFTLPASQGNTANKSLSAKPRKKKTMKSTDGNLSGDKTLYDKDHMKSPRPLLRKYIHHLLKAAGWEITLRTKNDANYGYMYKPPQRRSAVWDIRNVWSLCGQNLCVDRSLLVIEDGKQWNDMASFWSDLRLTLSKVDEEPSLVQQWCLLDPYVNLVCIEKKVRSLKAGEVVEARNSSLIDSHVNEGTVLSSKRRNKFGKQSQRVSHYELCESPLVGASALSYSEANNYDSNDNCGTRITVDWGKLNGGTVKALNGVPVSLSEEKCKLSRTKDGLNVNHFQANGLDGNSDHSSSCLHEAPITPQNEYLSDHNEETTRARNRDIYKRSNNSHIKVEDPINSAMIRRNTSNSSTKTSTHKTKAYKFKPLKKRKTQKGSCRLQPRSLVKGAKHNDKKCFSVGSRTVLSWLISCGSVSLKEVIQYRKSKDNTVVKEGLIMKEGILCICCNEVLSVSKFKLHAGFRLNGPCLNLMMGSGKSFTLCQLEAWSNEYKIRKSATRPVEVEDLDQNDDSCGLCGDGGELICCDNCPSTFHQRCFPEQGIPSCLCLVTRVCEEQFHVLEFPEGNWYCQRCTCRICGDLVVDREDVVSAGAFKCSQCHHKFHAACLEGNFALQNAASETCFCGESCQEVYLGLQAHVGALNCLSDGYTWTLLKCIHGDQQVIPAHKFVALKAECNSKLAVALTIMEECFLSMVDARTGIDMIPHVLYNWRSEFARMNYTGFYTMVLEEDDVLISAASIRIHGVTVAEMPLIATCSKYRRQGMCRRLMNTIEEMLKSFKVEKLVITAIPDLVETWTVGFGFEYLEDDERKSLSHANLMVFPGTVWLKKTMYKEQATDEQTSSGHGAPFCKDNHALENLCSDTAFTVGSARDFYEIQNGDANGDMQTGRDNALPEDFL